MAKLAEELRSRGKSVLLSFLAAEFVPNSDLRDQDDINQGNHLVMAPKPSMIGDSFLEGLSVRPSFRRSRVFYKSRKLI